MVLGVSFKKPRISSSISSRKSSSTASMMMSCKAYSTPLWISYWAMSSLCNASSLALVPAAARLLITVWRRYCFWGQIHSIPDYWSILEYSWSNVFQFCSCRGSKNRYCFRPEDSYIYYCFHRNYCI